MLLYSLPLPDRPGVEDVRLVSEYLDCSWPGKTLCVHLHYSGLRFDFMDACFTGYFSSPSPIFRSTDSSAWVLSYLRMPASLAILLKAITLVRHQSSEYRASRRLPLQCPVAPNGCNIPPSFVVLLMRAPQIAGKGLRANGLFRVLLLTLMGKRREM